MIDAKVLATGIEEGPIQVWGVWIPRNGDNLILPVEVSANYGVDLTVTLFEKSYADRGDGLSASASVNFDDATGRELLTKLGVKELVRVQLTLGRAARLPVDEVGWVLFRFLQPVWFESVRA